MDNRAPHDVRLVYLACAWLVAHRGHFLSSINKDNLSDLKDFSGVYADFCAYFSQNGYVYPWRDTDSQKISEILRTQIGVSAKEKMLVALLGKGSKLPKDDVEDFPFSQTAIAKLLCGGTCKLKDLFCTKEGYDDLGSISLNMEDEKLGEIAANIGDDYDLIAVMRNIFDWSVLVETIGSAATISAAKVAIYDQHKRDLAFLKYIIRKYCPEKFNDVFRALDKDNYVAYSYHTDHGDTSKLKKKDKEIRI